VEEKDSNLKIFFREILSIPFQKSLPLIHELADVHSNGMETKMEVEVNREVKMEVEVNRKVKWKWK
jgi:hypothetical protein